MSKQNLPNRQQKLVARHRPVLFALGACHARASDSVGLVATDLVVDHKD